MKENMTLAELRDHCAKMCGEYGDNEACNRCEFGKYGCCDPPDGWKLEPQPDMKAACAQPNWEEMFHKSEETCRQMYMKMEDAERRADRADEEIRRLRTIVGAVETMIGRKFDA